MAEMTKNELIFYDMAIAMRWKAMFASLKILADTRYERDRADLILSGNVTGKNETERRAQQDAALMGQQNVRDVADVALKMIDARLSIDQAAIGAIPLGLQISENVISSIVFGATSGTEQDKALAQLANMLCVHLMCDERFLPENQSDGFEDAARAYEHMVPAFVFLVTSMAEGTIASSTAANEDEDENADAARSFFATVYENDDDPPF